MDRQQRSTSDKLSLPLAVPQEYAARASRETPYPFSSQWDADDTSGAIGGKDWKDRIPLEPIGSYPPNAFSVHDMCGSVFEWTGDWFGLDYYSRSPLDDPTGPEIGYLRVVRGWYWLFTGPCCVANMTTPPWLKSPYIGFRVVCEMQAGR